MDRLQQWLIFLRKDPLKIHRLDGRRILQILPGAERPARPGEHDHPGLALRPRNGRAQIQPHLAVQRIHHLGSVQGDHRHAGGAIVKYGHRGLPALRRQTN